jgi:hypothetical protein
MAFDVRQNKMHFIFVALHFTWLVLMTFGAMYVANGNPFGDTDYLIAVCAVLSGCISLWFTRPISLAGAIAIPYFYGLFHLMRQMIAELMYVLDKGVSPTSTYATFGLGFLSITLWVTAVWFRSRTQRKPNRVPGSD